MTCWLGLYVRIKLQRIFGNQQNCSLYHTVLRCQLSQRLGLRCPGDLVSLSLIMSSRVWLILSWSLDSWLLLSHNMLTNTILVSSCTEGSAFSGTGFVYVKMNCDPCILFPTGALTIIIWLNIKNIFVKHDKINISYFKENKKNIIKFNFHKLKIVKVLEGFKIKSKNW